jgi:hypothetical protein
MDHFMVVNVINQHQNVGVLHRLVFILVDLNQDLKKMLIAVGILFFSSMKQKYISV